MIFTRNEQLEEIIRLNEADTHAWLIYSDWLQEQGDIRGTIISLELSGKDPLQLENLYRDHHHQWFSRKHDEARVKYNYKLKWRFCYVREICFFDCLDPDPIKDILDDPICIFLRKITVSTGRHGGKENLRFINHLIDILSQSSNHAILSLDLSNNDLEDLPAGIGDVEKLKAVNLSRNHIRRLPPDDELPNVEILNLRGNPLQAFPETLLTAVNLKDLDLSATGLTVIPAWLDRLVNLVHLKLGENRISALPPNTGKLGGLQSLMMNRCDLNDIPNCISDLKNLRSLDLSHNGIGIVPDWIGELQNLESLDLGFNEIIQLPGSFSRLTALKILQLEQNNLRAMPEFLKDRFELGGQKNALAGTDAETIQMTGVIVDPREPLLQQYYRGSFLRADDGRLCRINWRFSVADRQNDDYSAYPSSHHRHGEEYMGCRVTLSGRFGARRAQDSNGVAGDLSGAELLRVVATVFDLSPRLGLPTENAEFARSLARTFLEDFCSRRLIQYAIVELHEGKAIFSVFWRGGFERRIQRECPCYPELLLYFERLGEDEEFEYEIDDRPYRMCLEFVGETGGTILLKKIHSPSTTPPGSQMVVVHR